MDESPDKPHGGALRNGRVSIPGQPYLVTTTTKARQPLFLDQSLGRWVVRSIGYHDKKGYVHTMAFVVMPDHLHWLFVLGGSHTLSEVVGVVKSYSSKQINRVTGSGNGRIWQPGFHDRALRREEDVRSVARYIIANPLRAGIVDTIGDYSLWDAVWL